ncbi:phytanoyl-CoA dioxygenase family protein [Anditalea andensis]|uniref:Phytanoyl-CoA dioxygenase n=1 Tax=Anditalea andensis TaxID=1048983 RepID=A0A074KSM8_9BACT|nr:phytanoyl-CoA dioxygenase family protein [Anditalea andensis]KEO71929.1 hypothetical protein EL17_20650 [Anditalea andensis]
MANVSGSNGYGNPIDLLTKSTIDELIANCDTYPDKFLPWIKGRHTLVPGMYDLGSHPVIVKEVSKTLGNDVILWSSQIIRQSPSVIHRWHIDVEMARWPGLTVWVGMKNVTSNSLKLISGSHNFGISPQELAERDRIDLKNDAQVLAAAQKIDPSSKLIEVDIKDGQFIIFSGLVWHATQNVSDAVRTAMIFQYTTPEHKLFIPQNNHYPNTKYSSLQPDCILVKGKDDFKYNNLIKRSYSGSWKAILKTFLVHLPHNIYRKLFIR